MGFLFTAQFNLLLYQFIIKYNMKLLINLQKSRKKIFIISQAILQLSLPKVLLFPHSKNGHKLLSKKINQEPKFCLNTRSHIIQEEIIKRLWSIIASYLSHKKKKNEFSKIKKK